MKSNTFHQSVTVCLLLLFSKQHHSGKIAIFEFIQEKQDTTDLHRMHVIYIIAFNIYQNEIPLLVDDILRT